MSTSPKADWKRSEPRVVRPFAVARKLEHVLRDCGLRLKAGEPYEKGESIKVAHSEIGNLSPTLQLSIDQKTLSAIDQADIKSIKCLVFLESSFVKRTEKLGEFDLAIHEPIDLDMPIDLAKQIRFGSSTRVTVALCLTAPKEKAPGKLYRKGHWLAKKTFDVSIERDSAAFSIEPLDETIRAQYSLPPGTLYYISYLGGFNAPIEPESPPARVFVSKDVMDRLSNASQQKTSAIVESMLAAEITSYLVTAAFAEMEDGETVASGSPLASLLKKLQESCAIDEPMIRKLAKEGNGIKLRAYLHSDNQTVRNILTGQ